MTSHDLLPKAKKWLRAISDAADEEYEQTINACVLDLKNAGVAEPDLSDPLIQQAVKLYLKAQAGYEENAERFNEAYEHMKKSLGISSTYRENGDETEE